MKIEGFQSKESQLKDELSKIENQINTIKKMTLSEWEKKIRLEELDNKLNVLKESWWEQIKIIGLEEKLKSIEGSINYYRKKLESLKDEITSRLPWKKNKSKKEWTQWVKKWKWSESLNESVINPIKPSIITDSIMGVCESEILKLDIPGMIKNKIKDKVKGALKDVFIPYLKNHTLLKKDKNNKIIIEIDNKKKFEEKIKQVIDSSIPSIAKPFLKGKLDIENLNISDIILNMDANSYEKFIFWIIKWVADSVGWNITLQECYDSFGKYYPNRSEKVKKDLLVYGQRDIKDMRYPLNA